MVVKALLRERRGGQHHQAKQMCFYLPLALLLLDMVPHAFSLQSGLSADRCTHTPCDNVMMLAALRARMSCRLKLSVKKGTIISLMLR
jgi:hypothetical protein